MSTVETKIEGLAAEIETREQRMATATAAIAGEGRNFTDSEYWARVDEQTGVDRLKAELGELRENRSRLEAEEREAAAVAKAEQRSAMLGAAIDQAVERRSLGDLHEHFREAETRAMRGEGYRFGFSLATAGLLEERSTTTANAGSAREVGRGFGASAGIWLPRESGATNLNLPPGTRLEGAVYGANDLVALTAEGSSKPVLDPTSLAAATVAPYAVSSNVTIQSQAAGRGVEQFVAAGTRRVRRSVNDAFTIAMNTAGGTARAFASNAVASIDGAVAFSMAATATVPSLIVASVELFTSLANAGGGGDARDAFPAFRGIRLVPSAVTALLGNALVIDGSGLSMSLSDVEVRTQPQVLTNSVDCVVEVWFAVVSHGANAVTLQDSTTP